jgi:hypothetical protein
MKTNRLFLFFILFASLSSTAQIGLSNLSFENWGPSPFGTAPNGWLAFNASQQTSGAQNGTKFVRLTNSNFSTGTIILGTAPASATSITGGVPYTQTPLAISGFYKTAGIVSPYVVGISARTSFAGNTTAYASFTVGTNVATWTSFSESFFAFIPAVDSLFIVATSANFGGGSSTNSASVVFDLDNFSLSTTTGIDERSVGTSFIVYPNPATTQLNIISKDEKASLLIITDVNGKLLDEISITSEKTSVDLEKYNNGIYFYSIRNPENAVLFTSKFVVTR